MVSSPAMGGLLDQEHGLLDPDDREDVELVRAALEAKGSATKQRGLRHTLALLALSLGLFWLFQDQIGGGTVGWIAALVLVVLVHEGGHLLAMRVFGYANLEVFFIPGLGAAASGRKHQTSATERAMVSLMGPLPGLVFAFVAAWFIPFESDFLADVVVLALFLNAFNLLPLMPLDGGRYLDDTLFARWPVLRQIVGHLSGLALALIGWQLEAWFLLAIGVFVFMTAGVSRITGVGAAALREALVEEPGVPEPLPERIPDALIPAAIRSANAQVFTKANAKPTPASYANIITLWWTHVGKTPASVGVTFGLLLAYLASVALAVVSFSLFGVF
jgi:Zn-dependent protease